MSSSVCPCTLLELHVGSPRQQPTGAISAHVMALTHKPSFGRSVSQKGVRIQTLKHELFRFLDADTRGSKWTKERLYRRQGSAELSISERPKKYFATNRNCPKNKKQNSKKYSQNTIHFAKVKHDMIIMETHDY